MSEQMSGQPLNWLLQTVENEPEHKKVRNRALVESVFKQDQTTLYVRDIVFVSRCLMGTGPAMGQKGHHTVLFYLKDEGHNNVLLSSVQD
jgi:hypothetical protein